MLLLLLHPAEHSTEGPLRDLKGYTLELEGWVGGKELDEVVDVKVPELSLGWVGYLGRQVVTHTASQVGSWCGLVRWLGV